MKKLILDPIGYFLIRINNKEIEVAFCRYEDIKRINPNLGFGKNVVNMSFSSNEPKHILKWIKDNELISRKDHLEYMKKELARAKKCLKNKEKYIQD